MRNNYITTFLCLLIASSSLAQSNAPSKSENGILAGRDCECSISFLGLSTTRQHVLIDYSIPYGGVVEMHLFDAEGNRVWYNTYATDEGAQSIPLNRSAFRPGERYSYQLKYKTTEHKGEVLL